MRRWKPKPSLRPWIALALLLAALALAIFLIVRLFHALAGPPAGWPIDTTLYFQVLLLVGALVVVGLLSYRVGSALTLAVLLSVDTLKTCVVLDQMQTAQLHFGLAFTLTKEGAREQRIKIVG